MREESKNKKSNEKTLTPEDKPSTVKDYDEDLRRLEVSQLRILAIKRRHEFIKIAQEMGLKLVGSS